MDYWPKILQLLLLMLIYSHLGFPMKGQPPRKSAGLNPFAAEFHPQSHLIPNSPHQSQPPTSQFFSNTIQPHQQSADDPIKLPDFLFDFEENEKPITLPDSLFPWEEKEQILSSQDANSNPPEMGSNSQSIQITPPEMGSNNQNIQLTPLQIGQSENKQKDAHHFNRELIGGENPVETVQNKVDPVHHDEVSTYLKHGTTTDAQLDNKQNIDQSTKTFDQKHDITNYNRKLMTPTESKSASASKSGKVKQHHLKHQSQQSNRRDKNDRTDDSSGSNLTSHSSAHTQQQLANKTGEIATIKEIPLRNLDKAPEHLIPEIKMTKKDELNILEGQKVNDESRSIPLYNSQEQKQLEKEEKNEDNNEHKNQTKSGNNQQEKKGTSKKSKKRGKDKQKAVLSIAETRNMKIKEKEDEELLQKEIENRKKEIEKQKLEEEQLKMKEKNEEKQQGKQKLDNVFPSSNMPLKKEIKGKQLISHPALSATPPINPTMASGSSGLVVSPELASISPATIEVVAKSLSFLRKKEIERKEKLEKYNKIKKGLTKLQKKLDEIEKLEHSWLMERIEQFTDDDKNWNPDENGEEEIQKIRIQIRKLTDANESLVKEKENIMELTEKKNKLTSMINISSAKLKDSINLKKKKIKNTDKIAIANIRKLHKEEEDIEAKILEKQNYEKDLQKQIDELQKSLMFNFIKLNNNLGLETEKIKEIQKQMENPLKHIWIGYDIVLKILDEYWKTPEIEENLNDRKPYNFISLVFICIMPENKMNSAELSPFENTMKLALEKMLFHQNIYRVMNFKINVNGESISVYEKLNCFDELSKKMKILFEKCKEIELSENKAKMIETEKMKILGKFFKEELNQKFREVLSFIIVGLDELPDVNDQMVLNGIKQLSKWLPKNRKRQMDEIWILLFNYYFMENSIIQFLSKDDNDKDAENVFDLSPDDDDYFHDLENEVDTINDLYGRILSFGFSKEIENFMSEAFGKIKAFIQSIKILVKIEKREKDAKPLPYLKSVYDKYWYMIYKDRILPQLNSVLEYEFGREINQKERAKIIKELLDKASFERNPKVKEIFQQIALVNIDILVELMKVFDVIDKIFVEIKIIDRIDKYDNDQDFMESVRKDNPNIDYYNSLWEELYGNDDSKNADLRKEIAEIAK